MRLSRVKEIIEKRFQITMTKNMSYQLLWHSGDEKILISNIRSDYKVITMIKASTSLSTTFANERQLIKILNSFANIAGELNKNNKGEREMNKELNIEELLAELEAYRWREKKALILKKFGYRLRIDQYDREEKIKAYEEKKWIRLIDLCYIIDEVDELMLQGYTFDEIVRAMKEHIAEQLEAEKENE